jgi:hypothetical protein
MYYTNYNGSYATPYQHKVATSPDGLNWTEIGLVNSLGSAGAFDHTYIEDKMVYFDGTYYYLIYEGYNGSQWAIGVTKSTSPTSGFSKTSASPVLSPSGISGAFDQYQVATPYIYQDPITNNLYLFYQGGNNATYANAYWKIGIASIQSLANL